jgi:hypothetical protein
VILQEEAGYAPTDLFAPATPQGIRKQVHKRERNPDMSDWDGMEVAKTVPTP